MTIVGTWRLVRATAATSDGEPLPGPFGGTHAMGRLVFDARGRMMGMVCDGREVMPAGQTRDHTFYSGNYTYDGRLLTTRVDVAIDKSRLGTEQVREVSFDGPLMVLRPPLRQHLGRMEKHELVWERICD
jgi:hypothetical protein